MSEYVGQEVAVLKVGREEGHIEVELVSAEFASNMVGRTVMQGWDVSPINCGWRIMLPDDEIWQYVDLLDRAALEAMTGVKL